MYQWITPAPTLEERDDIKTDINTLLNRAIKKASSSICRSKVVAIGVDSKGHPICIKFNRPRISRPGGGVHAEMSVMISSPRSLKTIYIARVNHKGRFLPLDPCRACSNKADDLGVRIRRLEELVCYGD